MYTHRPFLFSTDFMLIYVQTWAYEGLVVRPTSELRVKVMTHHLEEAGPNGRPPGGQGLEVGRWGRTDGTYRYRQPPSLQFWRSSIVPAAL